jgi:recA bacterial DNA recombination protein
MTMAEPLTRETIMTEPGEAVRRLRSALPEVFRSQVRSARELDRELREAESENVFRTAVPALDRLLDGGLPRGQLVELVGSRASGRFSALLAAVAAATSIGETAALVDLGDGLDPGTALAMGADLRRLLWVRPTTLKKALAATEMLIASGFTLVVLDLGLPPVRGGRGAEAAWLRLAREAKARGAALLVGSPYRVSGTAANVVLKAVRGRASWLGGAGSPWLLAGTAPRIEIEKHRGRLPGQSEDLSLTAPGSVAPATPAPEAAPKPRREERQPPVAEPLRFRRSA